MYLSEDDLSRPPGRKIISHLFIFLILLFSSCGKKNPSGVIQKKGYLISKSSNRVIPNYILLREAKYSDIPIPLGFRFALEAINLDEDLLSKTENSDFLCYLGSLPINDLLDFYRRTMENEGWEIVDLSNEKEGLLFCNKISKVCVVSLRKDAFVKKKLESKICLFIKDKKQETKCLVQDINAKKITCLAGGKF